MDGWIVLGWLFLRKPFVSPPTTHKNPPIAVWTILMTYQGAILVGCNTLSGVPPSCSPHYSGLLRQRTCVPNVIKVRRLFDLNGLAVEHPEFQIIWGNITTPCWLLCNPWCPTPLFDHWPESSCVLCVCGGGWVGGVSGGGRRSI